MKISVSVEELLARLGAKDIELMKAEQQIAALTARCQELEAATKVADEEVTRLRGNGE